MRFMPENSFYCNNYIKSIVLVEYLYVCIVKTVLYHFKLSRKTEGKAL